MAHRKVTKGREELSGKLAGIRGTRTVIVFDGKRGETASSDGNDPEVVVTSGGDEGMVPPIVLHRAHNSKTANSHLCVCDRTQRDQAARLPMTGSNES